MTRHRALFGMGFFALLAAAALPAYAQDQAVWGASSIQAIQAPAHAHTASPLHQLHKASRKLQQASLCATVCGTLPKSQVCGKDKKTYGNSCFAFCAKTAVAHFGSCSPKPCLCPPLFSPVCASGKSFFNPCMAACAGAKDAQAGLCRADCKCPSTKLPVTGMDGKVYDNMCKAACAGTGAAYSGTSDNRLGTCKCAPTYDPVCESTTIGIPFPGGAPIRREVNVTHLNPCIAECNGAKETKPGVCSDYIQYKPTAWGCGCPLVFEPVCASFGTRGLTATAINTCVADCQGMQVVSPGICPGCNCPATAKPVCAGKKTYKTACAARCEGGATTWTEGACTPCMCTKSGTSYPTACNAECLGETIKSKGICSYTSGLPRADRPQNAIA